MRVYKGIILITAIALSTFNSLAEATEFNINGFGSAVGGALLSGEKGARFYADNPSRGFYEDALTFKPESMLAVRATADLGSGLSVTGQLAAKGGQDFKAEMEWAYLAYQFAPQWSLQVGRLRIPFFHYSQFYDVGYAYPWIRPPVEVYLAPVSTMDGVKGLYQNHWGNLSIMAEVYFGRSSPVLDALYSSQVGGPATSGFDSIYGGASQFNYKNWQARLGMARLAFNGEVNDIQGVLGTAGAVCRRWSGATTNSKTRCIPSPASRKNSSIPLLPTRARRSLT